MMNGGRSGLKGIRLGDIVLSKAGRDGGAYFLVVGSEGAFVYLADGKVRRLESPKRKNEKHVQKTGKSLSQWESLSNKNLRAAIGALFQGEAEASQQGRKELV